MLAYHYDESGYFDGTVERQKDDLESKKKGYDIFLMPARSTDQVPPPLKEGFRIKRSEDSWVYEENENPSGDIETIELSLGDKNEQIRLQRQARFEQEADPLRLDWDESAARGEEQAEEKKRAWLAKKDEIRAALPYIVEES